MKKLQKKRQTPKFRRQKWQFKRMGEKWRRPRGRGSKMRLGKKGKPPKVKIGYKLPKSLRGLHPSGFFEIVVNNPIGMEKLDQTKNAIKIASCVGKRKREKILTRAKELKIKVLNP